MPRASYARDSHIHTGLPLLGWFHQLGEADDTEAGRQARAAERARRAARAAQRLLEEARAKPAPKFRFRHIAWNGETREEDFEPGAELLGYKLPAGLRTLEAIAEELKIHRSGYWVEIKDGVLVAEDIPF